MAVDVAITVIGLVVLLVGLFSGPVRQSPVSEAMLALAAGVLLGPQVLGWLEPQAWGDEHRIMELVARLTIAIGVMGVALGLPRGFFRRHLTTMGLILGPVMIGMWLIGSGLAAAVLGVGWLTALLIGAIVTPTDPVLANSIVTGKLAERHLPVHLRETIAAESGANDGLALLLVMLPVLLLTHSPVGALGAWMVHVLLWQVLGAILIGALLGWAAGRLLEWAERRDTIEQTSLLAYSLALSLVVLGFSELIGSNGILAVFAAGRGFVAVVSVRERHEEERIQEAVYRFFLLPIFVFLGLVLPWEAWEAMGWPLAVLVALILLLRRLPVVWLLHRRIRLLKRPEDARFAGWFGPIGVAALFYALHVEQYVDIAPLWPVASLTVVGSIVLHGITAPPLTKRMSKAQINQHA